MSEVTGAHEQLVATIRQRMTAVGGRFTEYRGFCVHDMGTEVADVHLRGILVGEDPDLDQVAQVLTGLDTSLKWNLLCPAGVAEPVARAIAPAGFEPKGTPTPIMSLQSPPPAATCVDEGQTKLTDASADRSPDSVTIVDEDSVELLGAAASTIAECFNLPRPVAQRFVDNPLWLSDRAAVAVADGGASCALLTLAEGRGGLYYVATREDRRGEGLGSAVAAALTNLAFERGCHEVILQASDLGEPVYRRLGYRTIGHYRRFSNRDDE
ncbi:MAG: GNAT family N-acetyltransferase [Flaviflexus sp.]|nr:GNAT family N-acetyltransferase [Flaviflexus sp.]